MRVLFALSLLLGACSGGNDTADSTEPVQSENPTNAEMEEKAKSIEEAADAAVELVEAESRQEIKQSRPKIENAENQPQ